MNPIGLNTLTQHLHSTYKNILHFILAIDPLQLCINMVIMFLNLVSASSGSIWLYVIQARMAQQRLSSVRFRRWNLVFNTGFNRIHPQTQRCNSSVWRNTTTTETEEKCVATLFRDYCSIIHLHGKNESRKTRAWSSRRCHWMLKELCCPHHKDPKPELMQWISLNHANLQGKKKL